MHYTTLGKTGLKVSVAGLGCGGNSRIGLGTGLTEAQSVALVREALDLGVNFLDTAAAYETEGVVGLSPRPASFALEKTSPRIAIIIDDMGIDRASADALLALPFPLTVAVLPHLDASRHVAELAWRRGGRRIRRTVRSISTG